LSAACQTLAKALMRSDCAASEASVSRLQTGRGLDPETKEGELALLFLRLYRSLDALVGGDERQPVALRGGDLPALWVLAQDRRALLGLGVLVDDGDEPPHADDVFGIAGVVGDRRPRGQEHE